MSKVKTTIPYNLVKGRKIEVLFHYTSSDFRTIKIDGLFTFPHDFMFSSDSIEAISIICPMESVLAHAKELAMNWVEDKSNEAGEHVQKTFTDITEMWLQAYFESDTKRILESFLNNKTEWDIVGSPDELERRLK